MGAHNPHRPLVSVIMPIRNEVAYIGRSLQAVLGQTYPADRLEIIVVDGMSTDGTRQVVGRLQARHARVQLIDNPDRFVAAGWNKAIRRARGEVLIRVDGHCEIAPDYVARCVYHLHASGADGVGGVIETVGETPAARAVAAAMSSAFGVGGSLFRTGVKGNVLADTIPFPAYTRTLVEQAGLLDEELIRNQDDEYNYRIRSRGGKLLLAADVNSRYYARSTAGSVFRQYFQYGYYKVRVLQKHPRQMQVRQFAPPALVLGLVASVALALVHGGVGFATAGLIAGLYGAAVLAASAITAARTGWRHLPRLPLVFAALHLGYGLGFVTGLVKFWNRWNDRAGRVPAYRPADAARG